MATDTIKVGTKVRINTAYRRNDSSYPKRLVEARDKLWVGKVVSMDRSTRFCSVDFGDFISELKTSSLVPWNSPSKLHNGFKPGDKVRIDPAYRRGDPCYSERLAKARDQLWPGEVRARQGNMYIVDFGSFETTVNTKSLVPIDFPGDYTPMRPPTPIKNYELRLQSIEALDFWEIASEMSRKSPLRVIVFSQIEGTRTLTVKKKVKVKQEDGTFRKEEQQVRKEVPNKKTYYMIAVHQSLVTKAEVVGIPVLNVFDCQSAYTEQPNVKFVLLNDKKLVDDCLNWAKEVKKKRWLKRKVTSGKVEVFIGIPEI